VRARAITLLILMCSTANAGDRPKAEWPDGPNKSFLQSLQRPDNWKQPDRSEMVRSCCGAGDTVKTRFRVEAGTGPYPEDRWYAWLDSKWVAIPSDKIVPDYAPDGQPYLFLLTPPSRPDLYEILCFVRRAAGFSALGRPPTLIASGFARPQWGKPAADAVCNDVATALETGKNPGIEPHSQKLF
jgi:hypothetical protein